MHPLCEALQDLTNTTTTFQLPLSVSNDAHEAAMKAAMLTYYSGQIIYEVDSTKKRGDLRTTVMDLLDSAKSFKIDEDSFHPILAAKIAAVIKAV